MNERCNDTHKEPSDKGEVRTTPEGSPRDRGFANSSQDSIPDFPAIRSSHIITPDSYCGCRPPSSNPSVELSDGTAYRYHTAPHWSNREAEASGGECFRPLRTDVQPEFGSCPTCMGAIAAHRYGLHQPQLVLDPMGANRFAGTVRCWGPVTGGPRLARLKPSWRLFFKELWRRKLI